MTATQKIESILADPCANYWLQNALRTALQRDPVDAVHDAETLARLMRCYVNDMMVR